MPLFGGPASITIVIVDSQQPQGVSGWLVLIAGIVSVTALLWAVLRFAVPIAGDLSHTAMNVVTRLMGILLTAMAAEMIADGLGALFPVLVASA